jgi:hypothetical protein
MVVAVLKAEEVKGSLKKKVSSLSNLPSRRKNFNKKTKPVIIYSFFFECLRNYMCSLYFINHNPRLWV